MELPAAEQTIPPPPLFTEAIVGYLDTDETHRAVVVQLAVPGTTMRGVLTAESARNIAAQLLDHADNCTPLTIARTMPNGNGS